MYNILTNNKNNKILCEIQKNFEKYKKDIKIISKIKNIEIN